MTYGQLKFRLTKAFPGVGSDADLIEGWIGDVYAQIMGELPWSRNQVQAVLQTAAPYTTGTVALTKGSNAVTGTGTTWTAGMSGYGFRVDGQSESYTFTRTGNTTGTLDRNYESDDATGAEYHLFKNVYALPSDARLLQDDAFHTSDWQLDRYTRGQLDASAPGRETYGTPAGWALVMDDSSTPPNLQVELYPIPDASIGIPYTYFSDGGSLSQSSAPIAVWLQPAALVEGVTSRVKAHLRDYAGAQYHAAAALAAIKNMRTTEAQSLAHAQMGLSSHYTSHRAQRWSR